jgi:hypothetical protein
MRRLPFPVSFLFPFSNFEFLSDVDGECGAEDIMALVAAHDGPAKTDLDDTTVTDQEICVEI